MDVLELTKQLVSIPSVSKDSNVAVNQVVIDILSAAGFEIERLPVAFLFLHLKKSHHCLGLDTLPASGFLHQRQWTNFGKALSLSFPISHSGK